MKNSIIYISLLFLSGILAYHLTVNVNKLILFLVIYFSLFIIIEFLDMYVGLNIWSQSEQTSECYDWFIHYLKNDYGKNKITGKLEYDYSENIYFDNFDASNEESLYNKYNLIFNELNLSKGKKLLDCGCGIGVWMEYCNEKGVDVTGVTLSNEQMLFIKNKGLKAYAQDYRILNKEFINQFDAISVLGSTEHITNFSGFGKIEERSYNDYVEVFSLLKKYLKPNGIIYLTVMVQGKPERDRSGPYDRFQTYIMHRHYGGYCIKPDLLSKAITESGFTIDSMQDYTKDYHWISVVEPDHFGHWWIKWHEQPLDKILYFLKGLFTDPFLLHRWLYYSLDTWMWNMGGYQKTPLTDEQVKTAVLNLKYLKISIK